jgi:membrane-associated phospholipid phosphatase
LDKIPALIVYKHDMRTLIQAITDCGDLAILLPVACVLTLWAALIRKHAIFVWWLVALALCIGGTGILKIYFFACPLLSDLHSPSGHTSLSTLIYGTLTLAVARTMQDWRRWLAVIAGAMFILCIAVSRIVVQAHSIPEVLLGSVLGLVALSLFVAAYLRDTPTKTYLAPLMTISVMLVILLNGHELRAEEFLHRIAIYLNVASGCRA